MRNSGEDGRPGLVFIVARRASDVITDLCMAGRLNRECYETTRTRTPRSGHPICLMTPSRAGR